MIELYLHMKIYQDYIHEGWNMSNLENQGVLHNEFQYQKLLSLYDNSLFYKTVSGFMT